MTRSLVIAPQWIGDAVMTEPLLRRLQHRGEDLTVGAVPWVAPVYRAMPQVGRVIEFPFQHGGLQFSARGRVARDLEGHFDAAYVLPNSLKSALLPFLASIPRRIGYLGEARVGLLTHRLKNPSNKPPMVAFYSALSGERDGLEHDRPRLHVPRAEVDAQASATRLSEAIRFRTIQVMRNPISMPKRCAACVRISKRIFRHFMPRPSAKSSVATACSTHGQAPIRGRSRSHSSRIRMSCRWRRATRRIGSSRPSTA